MIDEKETFKQYGYHTYDLKPKSEKKVVAVCDGCGKVRILPKHNYHVFCRSCAVKGEKNPFFGKSPSEETRQKISEGTKGKHRSEETRQKISDALKGKKSVLFGKHHSEETRKKNSDAHKGIYPSEETRKKNSDAHKGEKHPFFGKHHSEEARKKISDAQKGENHYNWKNGASFEPYCSKFNESFKEDIRDKFDRVCFLCSKTEEDNGQRLSVHHVNGNKNCGCDGDETCQFVPLCVSCHGKVHSKKIDWEAKIKAKMRNKLNGWYI